VKDDSSLAHIPVILLVGAFDPLDEQEAQRVGADGVLKKPFVPPDPLISMVKSALMRASTAQAAGVPEKAPVSAMVGGAPIGRATSAAPTVIAVPKDEAPFVDEIPPKPEELKIDTGGKPLAFGSLLDAAVVEPVDDASFVTPASPELADRDWSSGEEENEEEEEEDTGSSSWRRDGGSEEFAPEPAGQTAAEKTGSKGKRRESWTPTREKTQNLLEEAVAPEFEAPVIPPTPAMPSISPVASVSTEGVAASNSSATLKAAPSVSETKASKTAPPTTQPEVAPPEVAKAPEPVTQETAKPSGGNSWFSTSSSPWEAEAQKATQLASTWDAPAAATQSDSGAGEKIEKAAEPEAAPEPTYDFVSEAPSEEPVHYVAEPGLVQNEVVAHNPLPDLISDGSISPETVESIRQETSYALESVTQESVLEPAAPKVEVESAEQPAAKIVETSQQDMDALVANVLAKMSPEMLQAVTREILKPVVAAMIRDEINAKKS
jgi:transcription termination factor NusB